MNKLSLNINQKMSITPNMINSLKILQLSSLDLEKYIENELIDNPLLDMKVNKSNIFKDSNYKSFEEYTSEKIDFREYLISQTVEFTLNNKIRAILEFLIYSLDHRGYLPENFKTYTELKSYNLNDIESARKILVQLDPIGVGAIDLKECLLLQIDQHSKNYKYKVKFINNFLYDLPNKSLEQISKESNIPIDSLKSILSEIKSLNPIPSNGYGIDKSINYIVPEAVVKVHLEKIDIEFLNSDHISISIDEEYLNSCKNVDDSAKRYIKKNMNKANYLMDSINKRNYTINLIIKEIVEVQKQFFVNNKPLKPLILEDIALKINLSISTVSRAIKDKYIEAPQGMFEIKYFFSNIKYNFNTLSKNEIKDFILDTVDSEDRSHPLSDQQISVILSNMGVNISRRTVSKYRIELNIESSYLRKK